MQTNNHKIVDYDLVLDAKFGKEGTPERIQAEEAAYSFYSCQILQKARKEAKVTQEELARRTNTTKSYISKIENGVINIPFTQKQNPPELLNRDSLADFVSIPGYQDP